MKHIKRITTTSDQERTSSLAERRATPYAKPRLMAFGNLHQVIRGASLKGVDSAGELDLENLYPG